MSMRISLPRPLTFLLGGLLLINLLQAFSTELIFDEAYYWYYAQNPSWGYFDHPPMVAWMIALGTWFLDNELGEHAKRTEIERKALERLRARVQEVLGPARDR